jgi:putative SOS response-associated peptidase YedK
MTTNQEAIRQLFRIDVDNAGNLPPLPGVYPDYAAPIVRNSAAGRELAMARWGMPTPPKFLEGKKCDPGVTNVRNAASSHWRRWLGPESRCLVPFTSFSESERGADGKSRPVWFAFDETRPVACFAGIWTRWTSVRKVREGETVNDIFAFLTINPNAEVGVVHPKAMPVILRTPAEFKVWMTAPAAEALKLQRPLPDGALRIVARGPKADDGANASAPALFGA